MDPALRLQPGQQELTPAQEAEARRFAEASIQTQLSTEPVDEQQAEHLLKHTYRVVGLSAPRHIHWVDGPLQLAAALASDPFKAKVSNRFLASRHSITRSIYASVERSLGRQVERSVLVPVQTGLWFNVGEPIAEAIGNHFWRDSTQDAWVRGIQSSISAPTLHGSWLAWTRFFATYFAPNEGDAWASFNELVSGYWLGREEAILVRRPCVLSRDVAGRLHSTSGKCVEYHDGWGCYAWHGVVVPEQVILAPETLTREDFLHQPNVEVRRVIQERMGERFVSELGGMVLDTSPRGTLYEVRLPADDPEQVARYVQVQDASTQRQYFLRVPPTVQTVAEAVAWSFQMAVEEYDPAQET